MFSEINEGASRGNDILIAKITLVYRSTTPGLLVEMGGSRTRTGNIQGELRSSCTKNKEHSGSERDRPGDKPQKPD